MDQVAELAAVTGRASRVGVKNDVAAGGHQLLFEIERAAVLGDRPAVNLQNQWIFLRRVEPWRLDDPALNLAVVLRGLIPDLFDLADLFPGEQIFVDGGQDFDLAVSQHSGGDVARIARVALDDREGAALRYRKCAAPAIGARPAADIVEQLLHIASERDEIKPGVALIVGSEIQPVSGAGPPRVR